MGTAHPNLVPYQAFRTSDGDLILAVGNDRQFAACMDCLGLTELASDPDYATNASRVENRAALVHAIQARLETDTTASWLNALAERGVPAGPVNDLREVLTNAHAKERNLVQFVTNGAGDRVPTVSNPVSFGATPVSYRLAPPLLGEHTEEVLRDWLGYSASMIDTLRDDAAI